MGREEGIIIIGSSASRREEEISKKNNNNNSTLTLKTWYHNMEDGRVGKKKYIFVLSL